MTEQPLSARVYASALRMYESDNRLARPKPEDYLHLDGVPIVPASPPPAAPAAPAPDEAAVRAALTRMQEASRVTFAPPPQDAA
jgi:hypothetical protein